MALKTQELRQLESDAHSMVAVAATSMTGTKVVLHSGLLGCIASQGRALYFSSPALIIANSDQVHYDDVF